VDCIVIQCACILQNASGCGSSGAGWPAVLKVSTKEKATSCCSCTRDAPSREGLPRYQPEGINCSRADQPTDLEAGIIATGGSNYIMRIAIFLVLFDRISSKNYQLFAGVDGKKSAKGLTEGIVYFDSSKI
jgi:hypothetical protein